jgi:tellurite resistance protein TerC
LDSPRPLVRGGGFRPGGPERGGEYLAGYVIEKSLSVDNVFVFALIFSYFAVPARYQYRVLFWGVVGALVLRGIFIALGAQLLERYDWMVYVFGALFPNYKTP